MGGGSAPEPPDPNETGAAQTSTNVQTAIANAILQGVNRTTPDGTLNYDFNFDDGYHMMGPKGESYVIPTITARENLTPQGQRIREASNQTRENVANIGLDATHRLGSLLGQRIDLSRLPGRSY